MARIAVLIGSKIQRHGQARATTTEKSRVDRRFTKTPNEWAMTGVWAPVKSSNVKKIKYERLTKRLWVQFRNNATYYYQNIPLRMAKRFFQGEYGAGGSYGKSIWYLRRKGFIGIRV